MSAFQAAFAEEWRPVVGYERQYEVSSLGRVRSLDRIVIGSNGISQKWSGRILKSSAKPGRYLTVALSGQKTAGVHVLVAAAFIGPRPKGADVCHSDGNKHENTVPNLRYDTRSGNLRDRHTHGTYRHTYTKVSAREVREIRRLAQTLTQREVASKFGISQSSVSLMVLGKTWVEA